jgi:hypothetical protein
VLNLAGKDYFTEQEAAARAAILRYARRSKSSTRW